MPPIVIDSTLDCLRPQLPVVPAAAVAGAGTNGASEPPAIEPQPPKSRALAEARRARQRLKARTLVRHEELDEKLQALDE